jgi:hypothetical protein
MKVIGYSWGRTAINIINMCLSISILTIIIYFSVNYKKVFSKIIKGFLDSVNNNRTDIQSSINKFSVTTLNNTLSNKSVQTSLINTANTVLTSPEIQSTLDNIIQESNKELNQNVKKILNSSNPANRLNTSNPQNNSRQINSGSQANTNIQTTNL